MSLYERGSKTYVSTPPAETLGHVSPRSDRRLKLQRFGPIKLFHIIANNLCGAFRLCADVALGLSDLQGLR